MDFRNILLNPARIDNGIVMMMMVAIKGEVSFKQYPSTFQKKTILLVAVPDCEMVIVPVC